MDQTYIIGVDIGGTNTDAVLVNQQQEIVHALKTATTLDIRTGFEIVLRKLMRETKVDLNLVKGIFLGTTHATNALLQKKDLYRVGVIRIAGHNPNSIPAGFSWPKDLNKRILVGMETINGGLECHGGPLTPFCRNEAIHAVEKLLEKQVESIAVIGVFSPLNGDQEREVADIVHQRGGKDFPVSLSHEIGGIGFIERENSTLLNAALKRVMRQGFRHLQTVCQSLNLTCPLMLTQNDGSLIDLERAVDYPILTISAGPTNSFIGGSRLAGVDQAIVVDIGGTSTDIGLVRNGFPLRSLNKSTIGGVSLNFPMPDVLSIALGGGSVIQKNAEKFVIGPHSVAKAMAAEALSFGGNTLTLTDVALLMGQIEIKDSDPKRVSLSLREGHMILEQVRQEVQKNVLKIQGESKNLPVILVGGGSTLIPQALCEEHYIVPKHFNVANAYGAALAEISGVVDTIVSLQNRKRVLEDIQEQAQLKAIQQGADPRALRLVDQQIIPYHYVPNQMARIVVRFCGPRKK